jgi:sulfite exporter TauE/SafE
LDTASLGVLAATAAFLGFLHTLTGPDHYVPFVAMARIGGWSLPRTLAVTCACGIGHVGSSVLLGGLGILLGWTVGGLEWFEGIRGDIVGWLLLGFGLAYMAWGLHRAYRLRPHTHWHAHPSSGLHHHEHVHTREHVHVHAEAKPEAPSVSAMTPWVLFTVFVFGPCEPLIPILMYPAAQGSWLAVVVVAFVFATATLATMVATVAVGYFSLSRVALGPWQRYSHAMAGFALFACGIAIKLGL